MPHTFEVRLKKPDGQIVSRHYKYLNDQNQAVERAQKLGIGRVISVRKVHASDVIGSVKSMKLEDIIGVVPKRIDNVVQEDTTVGDLVFGRKVKREERRFNEKVKEQPE